MKSILDAVGMSLSVGPGSYLVLALLCEHSTSVFLCAAQVLCSIPKCGKSLMGKARVLRGFSKP